MCFLMNNSGLIYPSSQLVPNLLTVLACKLSHPQNRRRFDMKLKLQDLYDAHARHVAEVNDWYDEKGKMPLYRAFVRAEQLLRLDVLIAQYQDKFATTWEPVIGRVAINHLLFSKTSREPDQVEKVRKIAFPDIFFLLHEDLVNVEIPSGTLELLDSVKQSQEYLRHYTERYPIELPPCSENEWDHLLSMKHQVKRKQ
ncbi:ECs1072 family phage-associated protein [Salmonella enterica subsp. diarizonae serovar 47:i:z53]